MTNYDDNVLTFIEEPEDLSQKTDYEERVDRIVNAMSEGLDAYISVHLQNGTGKTSQSFVTNVPADKYNVDQLLMHLQENYGGGDYRLRLIVNGRTERNKLYSVAGLPSSNKQENNGQFEALAQMIAQSNQQMIAMIKEQQKPEKPLVEQLKEIQMMQETFGMNKEPAPAQNPIEQIKQSLELVESLKEMTPKNNEEPEDNLSSMFTQLLQTVAQTRAQPRQQIPQQPIPQQPINNQEATQNMSELSMQMKMGLGLLIKAANKNDDPANYAAMVMNMAGDEKVNEFLNDENALNKLIQICPELEPKRIWFGDLIEHIKALNGDVNSKFAQEYDLIEETVNDKNAASQA